MSDRFLVEAGRKPVGVAVRVRGGFRFFSSDDAYRRLDGAIYRRVRALLQAVRKIRPATTRAPAAPAAQ